MSYEEGWLTKRSKWLKSWRRRYAYLYDTLLFVARDRESRPHHIIDLFLVDHVSPADEQFPKKKYSFVIALTTGENYFFLANSESDRKNWLTKIENVKKNPPRRVGGKQLEGKTFVVSPDDEEFYMITNDAAGHEVERARVDVVSLNVYQRSFLRKRENRGLPFDITEYNPSYSLVLVHLVDGTTLKVASDGVLGSTDPKKAKTIRTPSFIETD